MSTGESVNPAAPPCSTSLLADLESRQDELLRLLSELEVRTEQALAALGVKAAGDQTVAPGASTREPGAAASATPAAALPAGDEATARAPLKSDAQRPTSARPTTRRKAA